MFNPSVSDVRNFFFDTFAKASQQHGLSDLEKMAYSVIMEHPEYHPVLRDREKYLNYKFGTLQVKNVFGQSHDHIIGIHNS